MARQRRAPLPSSKIRFDIFTYRALRAATCWHRPSVAVRPAEIFLALPTGRAGDVFDGFQLGTGNAIFDDTLLLIEPAAAASYDAALRAAEMSPTSEDVRLPVAGATLPQAGTVPIAGSAGGASFKTKGVPRYCRGAGRNGEIATG